MKVALDVRPALSRPTGVGIYIGALASALPRLDPQSQFTLFSSSYRERWRSPLVRRNVDVVDLRIPVRVLNFAWNRLAWPFIETLCDREFDIVHSPHSLLTPSRTARRIITIHDLFFLKHREMTGAEIRRDHAPLVRDHAARADGIICPSEYTASEVERLLEVPREKICVTLEGVDPVFRREPRPEETAALLQRFKLAPGSILYVGSDEPRKNLGNLLVAYRRLCGMMSDPPALVMVGPRESMEMGRPGASPRVVTTGYLETPDIRALMAACACLVLPSLEEGFGLPVAEAMSAGLPVVCSAGSSLEEIAGGAAELIDDPLDPERIARALEVVLTDPSRAARFAALGIERSQAFDWDRTARMTLAFYRAVLES